MTTVQRMAFVWSRLALAAVLAAGAACAPTQACPEASLAQGERGQPCDAPRLVCSEGASFVVFGDSNDDAIAAVAPAVAETPRVAVTVAVETAPPSPARRDDVLVVAPKTSPPRT